MEKITSIRHHFHKLSKTLQTKKQNGRQSTHFFHMFYFFCLLWKGLNISDTNAVIPIWVSQVWLRSHDRQILSLANYTNRRRPSGSTSLLATLYPSTHTNYPAFQSILCVTGFLYVKHFHLWCLNIIIKTTISFFLVSYIISKENYV